MWSFVLYNSDSPRGPPRWPPRMSVYAAGEPRGFAMEGALVHPGLLQIQCWLSVPVAYANYNAHSTLTGTCVYSCIARFDK